MFQQESIQGQISRLLSSTGIVQDEISTRYSCYIRRNFVTTLDAKIELQAIPTMYVR